MVTKKSLFDKGIELCRDAGLLYYIMMYGYILFFWLILLSAGLSAAEWMTLEQPACGERVR